MRAALTVVAIIGLVGMMTGCAAQVIAPATGFIYSDVKGPWVATANPEGSKVGTAEATSILGIVASGDASIKAAADSAGIKKIHTVDYKSENILGIYAKLTTIVTGE